ncbi:hypothetical protein [Streptomyces buecherae]|uniref:hypothetical protein n=1 Tax=Streptomyces buecherae TaxID=2763006 RepID=UPI001C2677B4|nr:hypothetical protein [Streptomyces buecherae]
MGWHSLTLPTYLGDHLLAALGEAGGGPPYRLVTRAAQLADTIAAVRPTTGGRP